MFNKNFNQVPANKGRSKIQLAQAEYSNDIWREEQAQLPILVQAEDGCQVTSIVWADFFLDVRSQSIPGFLVSTDPPCHVSSLELLARAVAPKENEAWKNKGVPGTVYSDFSIESSSRFLKAAYDRIGCKLHFENASRSTKGGTERFLRQLGIRCLQKLPGYIDRAARMHDPVKESPHLLLTRDQLEKEIERWIIEDYHQRPHPKTGRKPAELWEKTAWIRMPHTTL